MVINRVCLQLPLVPSEFVTTMSVRECLSELTKTETRKRTSRATALPRSFPQNDIRKEGLKLISNFSGAE